MLLLEMISLKFSRSLEVSLGFAMLNFEVFLVVGMVTRDLGNERYSYDF